MNSWIVALLSWLGAILVVAFLWYTENRHRKKKPQPEESISGSVQKCRGCGRWENEMDPDKMPTWVDHPRGGDYDFTMTCSCGHVSNWIMGPGILICVDPEREARNA